MPPELLLKLLSFMPPELLLLLTTQPTTIVMLTIHGGFGRVVVENRSNLILNGSCGSIAILLKRLRVPVSTCPFQIQLATFQTDALLWLANERPPFWQK